MEFIVNKIFQMYPNNFYSEKANEAFEKGMDNITNGDYGKAYDCFLNAIELNPKVSKFHFFAGMASYYFQESESTKYFEQAAIMEVNEVDYQIWY